MRGSPACGLPSVPRSGMPADHAPAPQGGDGAQLHGGRMPMSALVGPVSEAGSGNAQNPLFRRAGVTTKCSIYTPCSHFLLWNRARCSDAAPPVLWDPPAARPSGLPVMCRVAALPWSARVPCFPCSSRLLGVFSHCFCVCLPATLSCVQVAGFPAAGLRVAGASVWRRKGSGGSRRHPPYPLSRPVPCICAGWSVCVLSPCAACSFPCCA